MDEKNAGAGWCGRMRVVLNVFIGVRGRGIGFVSPHARLCVCVYACVCVRVCCDNKHICSAVI